MTSTISSPSPLDPLGLEPIPNDTRQRFLRFRLSGKNETLLPLEAIAEVRPLEIEDILPIPEISSSVLGVCNWRGELLWLIDLNMLVGDIPLWHQAPLLEEAIAIVVQLGQQSIGLIVEQVDDVELIEPELIQPQPDLCSSTLATFVAGYLPHHQGTVLDAKAIFEQSFQAPP
ncbi:MAG: chemotaxis protein CheW [Cyanobacteria bacterium P01_F01_bin.13]